MRAVNMSPSTESLPAPAVFRAVQILEVLGESKSPLTITEISVRLGMAKSSVSNLMTTLKAAGMVRRAEQAWTLGYKVLELGQMMLSSTSFVREFARQSNILPTLQHETALVAALDGLEVVYLARHDGSQPIRLASDIGKRMPAPVTALGKAMLASLPPAELDARLAEMTELPRPTKRSYRTVGELRADLRTVRERGFAWDDEQNTIGVTCFAVAVRGGTQPTAVSTTLLTQRVTNDLRTRLVADLHLLANHLTLFVDG